MLEDDVTSVSSQTGAVNIGGVPSDEVDRRIAAALDAQPERLLNIYMDEKAPFASFVAVMDVAKEKRAGRFVISTRLPDEAGGSAAADSASASGAPQPSE